MSAFAALWYTLWDTVSQTGTGHDPRLTLENTEFLLLETGDFLLLE